MSEVKSSGKRPVRVDGDVAYVTLTKGYEAVIDAKDAEYISQWNWSAAIKIRGEGMISSVYAIRCQSVDSKRKTVCMHRDLINPSEHLQVDHIDGNGLNNRRSNLRTATNSENQKNRGPSRANRSGMKGVSWHAGIKKWQASIKVDGKDKYLGVFENLEDAHKAYCDASKKFHGQFARAFPFNRLYALTKEPT